MDYRASIQQSLDYIDQNLTQSITVDALAAMAGFSPYHYYRVFQVYVGMPVMGYIRMRRMAHAATEIAGGKRILDVALNWGFDTHAGFTRAFRKVYGLSPEQYRIHGTVRMPERVNLQKMCDYQLTGGIVMEPKFVTRPAFKVAGYELRTTSQDGQNSTEIPAFWQDYMQNKMDILHSAFEPVNHNEYGICMNMDMQSEEFSYVIGLEVADFDRVPEGFFKGEIAPAAYVVFTTPPADAASFTQSIQGTWQYVWGEWFPTSGYEYMPGGVDFELYDERCMPESGKVIDIYIPVVKKA